jgi:hypothetical protein
VVQSQVSWTSLKWNRPADLFVGWVQPTIPNRITTGGLHPPHVLPLINGVTLPSRPLNHANNMDSVEAFPSTVPVVQIAQCLFSICTKRQQFVTPHPLTTANFLHIHLSRSGFSLTHS